MLCQQFTKTDKYGKSVEFFITDTKSEIEDFTVKRLKDGWFDVRAIPNVEVDREEFIESVSTDEPPLAGAHLGETPEETISRGSKPVKKEAISAPRKKQEVRRRTGKRSSKRS